MADQETSSNVLSTLDDQVPTAFYWQLTPLATLGGFLFGYDTSNIGSALNVAPRNLQRHHRRPSGHPRKSELYLGV